jgi:hypothetical protein
MATSITLTTNTASITECSLTTNAASTEYTLASGWRGPAGATGPAGASATVDQMIIDGSANAVAGNAVFDALTLKAPLANPTFTGTVTATGAVNTGARVTASRGTVGVGTVSIGFGLTDITGTSTDFLSRFVVGDSITFNTTAGSETRVITAIASDTSMTTLPFSGPSASGAEAYTHTAASAVMNASGAITGTTGTFSGAVSGTTGFFTGTVTAGGTNNWTGSTFSGAQAFTGDVSVTGNTTVAAIAETAVALGTVTTTATISITAGTLITATLTASTACTFTMPSAAAGKSFTLLLKQAAATGNGTATFTSVKWPAGTAPTITATAGRMDLLTFVSDGTNWYGSAAQNFTP